MIAPLHLLQKIGHRCRSAVAAVDRRLVDTDNGQGGMTGHLYSAVSFQRFRRELRAVFAGRRRHRHYDEHKHGNEWRLRRNIHRLEKALCMRPLRDQFASSYIGETVATYAALTCPDDVTTDTDADADTELVHWAHDVLALYCEKTAGSSDAEIRAARTRFAALAAPAGLGPGSEKPARVPYRRDLSSPSPVSLDDLHALARRRRSVRWFTSQAVSREDIDAAVEVAGCAPTACNRQSFELRIFDTPETAQSVARIPMGTAGYHENIPAVAVVVGCMDAFFDERDRHLIYIDGSLFAMGFLYALETLGLATCCINWPDIEEKEAEMARLIGLEEWQRPVMLIAIGHPDPEGLVPYSQKKPLDRLRRYQDQLCDHDSPV